MPCWALRTRTICRLPGIGYLKSPDGTITRFRASYVSGVPKGLDGETTTFQYAVEQMRGKGNPAHVCGCLHVTPNSRRFHAGPDRHQGVWLDFAKVAQCRSACRTMRVGRQATRAERDVMAPNLAGGRPCGSGGRPVER
ncbi:MAG: hypothetical protein ACLSUZ_00515 [Bifidobacterium pseudocatenulatum]